MLIIIIKTVTTTLDKIIIEIYNNYTYVIIQISLQDHSMKNG